MPNQTVKNKSVGCSHQLLFASALSVLALVSGCMEEPAGEELSVDRMSLAKGAGGTNGESDYCTASSRCATGEGDCDNNMQCSSGLVCVFDVGAQFNMRPEYDVCLPAHCGDGEQNQDETGLDCGGECGVCQTCPSVDSPLFECTVECPCPKFEGGCDSDAECQEGLTCVDPSPDNSIPSRTSMFLCMPMECVVNESGSANFCNADCPCDEGTGDCDTDSQCSDGLVCGVDNADQFWDGHGRGVTQFDACVETHCTNGIRDQEQGETGIDCGGACGECLAAHCNNGVRDKAAGETGIDCGGNDCGRCVF